MVAATRSAPPGTTALIASERIGADRPGIAALIAILSKQLPLPTAQQFAGQTVNAKMVENQGDGQIRVDIDGQIIQVRVQPNTKLPPAGQNLVLTLAFDTETAQPAITQAGQTATRSLAGIDKLQRTAEQSSKTQTDETNSSTVDGLSKGARLIGAIESLSPRTPLQIISLPDSLLQAQADDAHPAAVLPNPSGGPPSRQDPAAHLSAANTAPLLAPEQSSPAQTLARGVSDAVEHSGLFYESHLQQWAKGERSLEALAKEPQAAWPAEQVIKTGVDGSNPDNLPPSAKMASMQLQMLDVPRLSLSLPGFGLSAVAIEIQPDDGPDGCPDEQTNDEHPANRIWSARLKLSMPRLGDIHAGIRLIDKQIDIQLRTNAPAAEQINSEWPDIQSTLHALGLSLQHAGAHAQEPPDA
jgi:hypothetical protein